MNLVRNRRTTRGDAFRELRGFLWGKNLLHPLANRCSAYKDNFLISFFLATLSAVVDYHKKKKKLFCTFVSNDNIENHAISVSASAAGNI